MEEALNCLPDAEAGALCKASGYERNAERASTRSGYYERGAEPTAEQVRLKIPKLRHIPFETALIERYRRGEGSVEETPGNVAGRHIHPQGQGYCRGALGERLLFLVC